MTGTELIVAIDGPSGVGKSTISRRLAARLHYTYLDTGAMYRAVAYRCQACGFDPKDPKQVEKVLANIHLNLLPPTGRDEETRVLLNGQEIGQALRSPEMGLLASIVSAQPLVRQKLTELQRQIGATGRIVAEGRDTGTVVFPLARWKFYLDARPEIRATRRAAQLAAKGETVDEAQLLAQIIKRDSADQNRSIAPLKEANDAIRIDSSELSIDEVLTEICDHIALTDGVCA